MSDFDKYEDKKFRELQAIDQPTMNLGLDPNAKRSSEDAAEDAQVVDDAAQRDTFGPENPPAGTAPESKMLMMAAGWHPFLHLFVRIANVLYGDVDEGYRVRLARTRLPRVWKCLLASDLLLQGITVVLVLVFIVIAASKTMGIDLFGILRSKNC